ncbi:coiled-coil domain-containing protein [Legionella fallonii]|uniref:Uncharacterized protein n=1 Tax=Legionella fallonii LLAP-10 TaxID=1212491 RepID=A0A098G2I3_9GAMM|nr:hypothetical protein [Legionella fallonii]CEG56663.1 protein of unknown function [Legionella fallonii LLAP-10]
MKKSELRKKAEGIIEEIALFEKEYKNHGNQPVLDNKALTKIESEVEKIKNYVGNYITLIRQLPSEDPPPLPPQINDPIDAVETDKRVKRKKRILNAQQQYKYLELGLSEFSQDFGKLKNQISTALQLVKIAQVDNDVAAQQRIYVQLCENLQQDIELAQYSVSSLIADDPDLVSALNQLKHHRMEYTVLMKQIEKKLNEASTTEDELVSYQYGIEQLNEYQHQYTQYSEKVKDKIHVLESIEQDYKKAFIHKNLSIAHAKKILNSPEIQLLHNDSSLKSLIDAVEKQVKELGDKQYIDLDDQQDSISRLHKAIQLCQSDKDKLEALTEKLDEAITTIQRQQAQLDLAQQQAIQKVEEQITGIQKEFDNIYRDIESKLTQIHLDLEGVDVIKLQFDEVLLESNTKEEEPMGFVNEKVAKLKSIVNKLNKELPEQESRIRKKLSFDIKFIEKGIISQKNRIIDKVRKGNFRLNTEEQQLFSTVEQYPLLSEETGPSLTLKQLNIQLREIKEKHSTFANAYSALYDVVSVHSAVKSLFRQDKTLTTETFIEATNSSVYGGQLLITLAQYVNKVQLIKIIEKNWEHFNEKGILTIKEYMNLTKEKLNTPIK